MGGFLTFNTDVPYSEAYVAVNTMDDEMKNFVQKSLVGDVYGPFFEGEAYKMYRLMGKHNAPDSVKVRHIMFPLNSDAATTTRIDSIYTVLKKGGNIHRGGSSILSRTELRCQRRGNRLGYRNRCLQFGKEFNDLCFNSHNNGVVRIESPTVFTSYK